MCMGAHVYITMYAMAAPTKQSRQTAARQLREILHGKLFRALCEPARVAIIEFLTVHGRSDIATIAEHFPQDRSVVSRHLALLHDAGVIRREKEGRQVFFEVDGPGVVERLENVLLRFRNVVPLCCPPKSA